MGCPHHSLKTRNPHSGGFQHKSNLDGKKLRLPIGMGGGEAWSLQGSASFLQIPMLLMVPSFTDQGRYPSSEIQSNTRHLTRKLLQVKAWKLHAYSAVHCVFMNLLTGHNCFQYKSNLDGQELRQGIGMDG
ncbi:hypothetical protein Taro_041264 [Colocasia esculenta]|uniref:Uncharacterized protein n=1 Tax=Colocasia esculenta TaxID=4460 RepID=A0A843WB21_COLES|nr:hypothetical protein [Colocasia esculenta]